MKFNCNIFIVVLLVTSCTFIVYSQQMEDVVYLKNGSVIHGVIIEQIPNVSIKIKTHDGNVMAYKYEDIEKFTKEETNGLLYGDYTTKKIGEFGFKERKFYIGLKAGYGNWGTATYGLSLDYALSNYFGIGMDAAYTSWSESGGSFYSYDTTHGYTTSNLDYAYSLIGLLANVSYHFNTGEKFDPYLKAGVGYFLINATENWNPRKPTDYSSVSAAKSSGVGYGGQVGFNYFFSKSFSLSLSGGWPFYASGGATVRF